MGGRAVDRRSLMKFAVLSHSMPPAGSGQAMVLYRLLNGLRADDYCLITNQNRATDPSGRSAATELAGRTYYLPATPGLRRGRRFGLQRARRVANGAVNLVTILTRGLRVASILRQESCLAIVACTGDLVNLPAAFFASRMTGARFWAYIFDDYVYQWTEPVSRYLARRMEPTLLRGAAGVIVPNEYMYDELRRRYGLEPAIIHNPCDLAEYSRPASRHELPADDQISIVYTGAVYQAQADAMVDLTEALALLARPEIKLHIYSNQSPAALTAMGLRGPVVHHSHLPASALPEVHQRANLLYLPLAFKSGFPEVIRTSAPGKMGEYLAAGRPILVHAPADSYVAWYFRQYSCGYVVDQKNPAELADAVTKLLEDAALRDALSSRAQTRAEADFSIEPACRAFAQLMGAAVEGQTPAAMLEGSTGGQTSPG
jgi:glycosyltransferase involved in cell wall biosynthesis